jgi:hypothetical protein
MLPEPGYLFGGPYGMTHEQGDFCDKFTVKRRGSRLYGQNTWEYYLGSWFIHHRRWLLEYI